MYIEKWQCDYSPFESCKISTIRLSSILILMVFYRNYLLSNFVKNVGLYRKKFHFEENRALKHVTLLQKARFFLVSNDGSFKWRKSQSVRILDSISKKERHVLRFKGQILSI